MVPRLSRPFGVDIRAGRTHAVLVRGRTVEGMRRKRDRVVNVRAWMMVGAAVGASLGFAACAEGAPAVDPEAAATLTLEELNALSCGVPAGAITVRLSDCAVSPVGAAAAGPISFHAIPPTAAENGGALRELVIARREAPGAPATEVAAIREVLADRPRDLSVELPAGDYELQCRTAEAGPRETRVFVTTGTVPLTVTAAPAR